MEEYSVKFYKKCNNGQEPVLDYIKRLDEKNQAKVLKYIAFLRDNRGYLDEPFSKHITGKIRELRACLPAGRLIFPAAVIVFFILL